MTEKEFLKYIKGLDLGEYEISVKTGVIRQSPVTNQKGEIVSYKTVPIVPVPIIPTAIITNCDTNFEKVELTFKKTEWRSIIVDREQIASTQKIVGLSNTGTEINSNNAKSIVGYFADVIARNLDKIPKRYSRNRLGWFHGKFVPYSADISFDGEDQCQHLFNSIRQSGTLEDWVEYVGGLRVNQQMRMMLSSSFASPLIELAEENPFIFHCWGTTSFCKTVSLMVAMSVWGNPAAGALTKTLNMTVNAMLTQAAFLNNVPFAGDELQTIKSKWQGNYDGLIMCLTEGIDRGRMSYDKVNETRSWKCSFITTGEEPAVKSSSGGGAKNRVIEMECKQKLIEDGNGAVNFVKRNYGTAAPAFIEYIKNLDIQALYKAKFEEILNKTNTTDKQAGAMALILVADDLVRELFWPAEEPLTVEDVKQYLATDVQVSVAERAYEYICDHVSANVNRFDADNKSEIWGKIEGGFVYFNRMILDRELAAAGYDFGACKREWLRKGYIFKNPDGLYRWRKTVKNNGMYCIKILLEKEQMEIQNNTDDDELPF